MPDEMISIRVRGMVNKVYKNPIKISHICLQNWRQRQKQVLMCALTHKREFDAWPTQITVVANQVS